MLQPVAVNFSVLVLTALLAGPATAQNWPSFRGPNASGVADGLDLPTHWDAQTGANVDWKTAIPGLGHSSPVVWEDRVFLTTAVSDDPSSIFVHGIDGRIDRRSDLSPHTYYVYGLDRATGHVLWRRQVYRGVPKIQRQRKNSYASPTPVTDGERVVAYFGSEGLYAFDLEGTPLWNRDLGVIDAGASYDDTYDWGPASSPIIFDGLVIVLADQQAGGSFIAAFDAATGEPVWRAERDVISSFSTPTLYQGEKRVELLINGAELMQGYDPMTGKELWRLAGSSKNTTPTPVVWNDLVFIVSGYRIKPIFAIRPGGSGDIAGTDFVAWRTTRDGSYMTTPVAYRDYLYTLQDNGVLSCYRARSGERVYQTRAAAGAFSASPIVADGRLYLSSEEGEVYVVRAGPDYELLHRNAMGEVIMATPAAAKGQLLIRTQHHLFSIR
ncbi:MAG TPA: PQQ-binding-like beta-propeller repeat protein [Vicinamibacteria bacterium]|nr:PQQ-binding-like beta-propeller repeat protein [Vicinamibacteria bacterium]